MRLTCSFLAFSLALVVVNSLETVRAATFNANIGGQNYTIVEVDPYNSGQEPGGNTQRVNGSGTFWSSTVSDNTDGLWNQRAYAAFNTGYTGLAGATDRVFEASYLSNPGGDDLTAVSSLRTTVGGLPANNYNVFLLYTTREDGNGDVFTRASLNTPVANGSNFGVGNALAYVNPGAPIFKTAIAPLGSTGPNSTGFFVEIGTVLEAERVHALAVAYQIAPAIPEPASAIMMLIGFGGFLRLARRRSK